MNLISAQRYMFAKTASAQSLLLLHCGDKSRPFLSAFQNTAPFSG